MKPSIHGMKWTNSDSSTSRDKPMAKGRWLPAGITIFYHDRLVALFGKRTWVFWLSVCFFSLLGCQKEPEQKTSATTLCGKVVHLEIAKSPEKRRRGLMGRTSLPHGQGMIFIFEFEHYLSFWMKNVPIPLSIGFFDNLGRLLQVHEMVPEAPTTLEAAYRRYGSHPHMARYAVEMEAGWFHNKTDCQIDLTFLKKPN